jgi:hypothetical protein
MAEATETPLLKVTGLDLEGKGRQMTSNPVVLAHFPDSAPIPHGRSRGQLDDYRFDYEG